MKHKCELREDGICDCPKNTCKEYDRINKPNTFLVNNLPKHFLGLTKRYKKLYR